LDGAKKCKQLNEVYNVAKLTKRVVDAAQAPKLGQSFLWDGELRGFGVRVMQSGLKTFILQYRNAEGRSRRMVLGRYGVLTVEQARDQARIRLGLVAGGSDPAQDKQELRAAPTVSDICNWYLEEAEAGRLIGRRRRPIKESTVRMERSRIERHIKPILGHRQIRGLKLHDIETMQAEIAAGKTRAAKGAGRGRKTTGGGGAASRCASTLHSVFGHAKRLGKIETNPASGIRRLAGTPRDRRLSATEIVALGQAMRDSVAALFGVAVRRKIFVHINNTNPALLTDSAERAALTADGWDVAHDGMEIAL